MSSIKKLSLSEVSKKVQKYPKWSLNTKGTEISRTFLFSNFVNALSFVAKVTVHAEILEHHPDIELSYGKVKVILSTHDVKGLTVKDFDLAKKIDGLQI